LGWVWDTDGSALNLPHANVPETCRDGAAPSDAAVLAAIEGVESWSVQGPDAITLEGARELGLARIRE
jgi:hypothetical protein